MKYPVIQIHDKDIIKEIPLPENITLHLARTYRDIDEQVLTRGKRVHTGQKVPLSEDGKEYFISTATGTISDICEYIGYLGQSYTSISIKTEGKDTWDSGFKEISEDPASKDAIEFLKILPGNPDFASIIDPKNSFETIVISGIDNDLLVATNQFIVKTGAENLRKGIDYIKKMAGGSPIVLIVPPELAADAEKTGADIKVINSSYPDSLPEIVMKKVFNRIVPAGRACEDLGVAFLSAEAVSALGASLDEKKIKVDKIITVINKEGRTGIVRVRIGTPVGDVLKALNIETEHGDRLVLGGPMRGISIYTDDMPVSPDTDAIMIQDKDHIVPTSDTPCINCGECVRACPANIQVNMLVRLLENGHYEEAADEYDLFSCIECGLCAYVCVARIPIFHYIMLGKYEIERMKSMEESHA